MTAPHTNGLGRRLAARLASESITMPVPPPPRSSARGAATPAATVPPHSVVVLPPPPMSMQFPGIDPADLDVARMMDNAGPRRSLLSLPVAGSLIASLAVMGAIAWVAGKEAEGLRWSEVKQAIKSWMAKPELPDEELPYITAIPIVPGAGGMESLARLATPTESEPEQIVLGDPMGQEGSSVIDSGRLNRK